MTAVQHVKSGGALHLQQAARTRHQATHARATDALARLAERGESITFVSVARAAHVSTDFLYRQPELRARIEQLRRPLSTREAVLEGADHDAAGTSAAVRALASRIKQMRREHNAELDRLRRALEAAQGENLQLRRQLRLRAYEPKGDEASIPPPGVSGWQLQGCERPT